MKTEELILIVATGAIVYFATQKKTTASGTPTAVKTPTGAVQTSPNSRNPNVGDTSGLIGLLTPVLTAGGNYLQGLGDNADDNSSFNSGDLLQDAFGTDDFSDYLNHLA